MEPLSIEGNERMARAVPQREGRFDKFLKRIQAVSLNGLPLDADMAIQRNITYTQSYIDIATTLITVDIFAGAICIGSLANVNPTFPQFEYVTQLLAISSLIFICPLFFAFGILYIMRNEPRDRAPSRRRRFFGSLQYLLGFILTLAGFAMCCVLLIAIGQPIVGYTGIGMVVSVPFWVILMMIMDRAGWMDDPPEAERVIEVGQVQEQPHPKLAENPIYYTSANKHILP